jgi:hypothetical protein
MACTCNDCEYKELLYLLKAGISGKMQRLEAILENVPNPEEKKKD